MISRIGPVEQVSGMASVDANVRRTDFVPSGQTGGISVHAADTNLLETLGARSSVDAS